MQIKNYLNVSSLDMKKKDTKPQTISYEYIKRNRKTSTKTNLTKKKSNSILMLFFSVFMLVEWPVSMFPI